MVRISYLAKESGEAVERKKDDRGQKTDDGGLSFKIWNSKLAMVPLGCIIIGLGR